MRRAGELAGMENDRYLRDEALLIVASADALLILSGNGEVIEPDDGIATIGSGGAFAGCSRALVRIQGYLLLVVRVRF